MGRGINGRVNHNGVRPPILQQNKEEKGVQIEIKTTPAKKEMKKWPNDKAALVPYYELIGPLRSIIFQGYKLDRKAIKNFEYDGFTIGEEELMGFLPPDQRFKENYINDEDKLGRKLIDIILNVVFLLGIEQGRRKAYRESHAVESLIETLETYRDNNKDLRRRIDELEVQLEIAKVGDALSEEEASALAITMLEEKRIERIKDIKKDLELDSSRSAFKFGAIKKMPFKELEAIGESLKKSCTVEEWKDVLAQHGWTFDEWNAKCKKKKVNLFNS